MLLIGKRRKPLFLSLVAILFSCSLYGMRSRSPSPSRIPSDQLPFDQLFRLMQDPAAIRNLQQETARRGQVGESVAPEQSSSPWAVCMWHRSKAQWIALEPAGLITGVCLSPVHQELMQGATPYPEFATEFCQFGIKHILQQIQLVREVAARLQQRADDERPRSMRTTAEQFWSGQRPEAPQSEPYEAMKLPPGNVGMVMLTSESVGSVEWGISWHSPFTPNEPVSP